ncbi:hypothetical protein ACHAWF_000618 [Thalassiosira exigua]
MADHIIELEHLNSFSLKDLGNTVWAFSKAGEPSPRLSQKVRHHIAGLEHLDSFKSQELSNKVWAYATAGDVDSRLF